MSDQTPATETCPHRRVLLADFRRARRAWISTLPVSRCGSDIGHDAYQRACSAWVTAGQAVEAHHMACPVCIGLAHAALSKPPDGLLH